ncbi:MAG: hypothetical protein KDJ88_13260 [Bauldia sp.]|nr:hypothetical protein [Bauldia sp.]
MTKENRLSDFAKLACLLTGMSVAVGLSIPYYVRADSQFKEVVIYEPEFDREVDEERRAFVSEGVMQLLAEDTGTLCQPDARKRLRTRISQYFHQRALSLAIADRDLSQLEARGVRQEWDGTRGEPVRDAIQDAAAKGLVARSDFPLTYPELAALLEEVHQVAPLCG